MPDPQTDPPPDPSFIDAARLGRHEGWRCGAAVLLFIGGYLGGAFLLIIAASAGYGMLSRAFPDSFAGQPFLDLFNMQTGWPEVPTASGLFLFGAAMGTVIVALPVLALIVRFVHRRRFASLLGKPGEGFDWSIFVTSFSGATLAFGLFTGVELLLFGDQISLNGEALDILYYLPLAIVVVPLQVLAEEVVFRGYLLQTVSIWITNRWVRIALPALAFAVLHKGNAEVQNAALPAMVYFIIFSFYITWFTARSGGIAAAVGMHLAMNLFAAFVISSSLSAYISPTLFYIDQPEAWMFPLEIISVIAVYHAFMKRRGVI